MRRTLAVLTVAMLAGTGVPAGSASAEVTTASLRGSTAAMQQQNRVAREHGLDFYRTEREIMAAATRGDLLHLGGNDDYEVADFVRLAYLRPAGKLFVERLSSQYRAACGQKLVVTSAVRPTSGQPRNAHALSVHPAGMAIDLRVSDRASCREWLEDALLALERRGVLNGIREYRPPHYHVAVFPEPYVAYVAEKEAAEAAAAEAAVRRAAEARPAAAELAGESPPGASGAAGASSAGGEADAGASSPLRLPLVAALAVLGVLPLGRRLLGGRRRTEQAGSGSF